MHCNAILYCTVMLALSYHWSNAGTFYYMVYCNANVVFAVMYCASCMQVFFYLSHGVMLVCLYYMVSSPILISYCLVPYCRVMFGTILQSNVWYFFITLELITYTVAQLPLVVGAILFGTFISSLVLDPVIFL
jgi:hypothetical protein